MNNNRAFFGKVHEKLDEIITDENTNKLIKIIKKLEEDVKNFKKNKSPSWIKKIVKIFYSKSDEERKIEEVNNYMINTISYVKKYWTPKYDRLEMEKRLDNIEEKLGKILSDTVNNSKPIDAQYDGQLTNSEVDSVKNVYDSFSELNLFLRKLSFKKIKIEMPLKFNNDSSLESFRILEDISFKLNNLRRCTGKIFKHPIIIKNYKSLRKIYSTIKMNIVRRNGWVNGDATRAIFDGFKNAEKQIMSMTMSWMMDHSRRPNDPSRVKSALKDLYNAFGNLFNLLFKAEFKKFDFENFIVCSPSVSKNISYFLRLIYKDLNLLYKTISWKIWFNYKISGIFSKFKSSKNSKKEEFKTSEQLYYFLYSEYKKIKAKLKKSNYSDLNVAKSFVPNCVRNTDIIRKFYLEIQNELVSHESKISEKNRKEFKKLKDISERLIYDYSLWVEYIEGYTNVNKKIDEELNKSNGNANKNTDELFDYNSIKSDIEKENRDKLSSLLSNLGLRISELVPIKKEFDKILKSSKKNRDKKYKSVENIFHILYNSLVKDDKFKKILYDEKNRKEFISDIYTNFSKFEFINVQLQEGYCELSNCLNEFNNNELYGGKEGYKDFVYEDFKKRSCDFLRTIISDYESVQILINSVCKSYQLNVLSSMKDLSYRKNEGSNYESSEEKDKRQKIIQKALDESLLNPKKVVGDKILGKIVYIFPMNLDPEKFDKKGKNKSSVEKERSSVDIVVSVENLKGISGKDYDLGKGYALEAVSYAINVKWIGSSTGIHVYIAFRSATAVNLVQHMINRTKQNKTYEDNLKKQLGKKGLDLVQSWHVTTTMDGIAQAKIMNNLHSGQFTFFPCRVSDKKTAEIEYEFANDKTRNFNLALKTYEEIKKNLKSLNKPRKKNPIFAKIGEYFEAISTNFKMASGGNPIECVQLIRGVINYININLNEFEAPNKIEANQIRDLKSLSDSFTCLGKYLVGEKLMNEYDKLNFTRSKNKCDIYGQKVFSMKIPGLEGSHIILTLDGLSETLNFFIKSTVQPVIVDEDDLGSLVADFSFDFNSNVTDKGLKFFAKLINGDIKNNYPMCRMRVYILTSDKYIKKFKNLFTLNSKSKKEITIF